MYRVLSCLQDQHSIFYVIAAVLICALSLFCTVIVFQRGNESQSRLARRLWAAGSGVVTGLGVWGTHFVAMLGYQPGFDVAFDGVTTAVSALMPVIGFITTSQILIGGFSVTRRALCTVIATSALSLMHFYGQTSLKAAALIEYDATYIIGAVLVCGFFFGLVYSVGLSTRTKWQNMLGLVFTLLAVAGVHFTGTAAMEVYPLKGMSDISWALTPGDLTLWIVTVVVLIIFAALAAARFDTVLARLHTEQHRRIAMLANSASEAILIADNWGDCIEVNQAAQKLFGKPRSALVGRRALDLIGLSDDTAREAEAVEISVTSGTGEEIPVEVRRRQLGETDVAFSVFALTDLRERLKQQADMRRLAFNDQLTGLSNRTAFGRELEHRLNVTKKDDEKYGVLLVDLDEFKDINDQFGHGFGDGVLIETARRLRALVASGAMVARLGGDEFAVFVRGVEDEETLEALAQSCVRLLGEPITVDGIQVRCGASVGATLVRPRDHDIEEIIKAADRALYAAKNDGRGRSRVYDVELHRMHEERRDLEHALARAIENDEFIFHYQPKVEAATREIVGYEALIRWERPGHGIVMPDTFIEVAEQSLLIQEIGRWSIHAACQEARRWRSHLTVAVNLSAKQFLDPHLYSVVANALKKSGLEPHRLELEITETALIHNTQVAAGVLERLKRLGVQIALDDFGTGYSSMRFVQQFPFDRIKIDRSFVAAMESDRKSGAIIEAILKLGHSLEIPVVAEGVESEEQALRLHAALCEELQGYLISRPGPISADTYETGNENEDDDGGDKDWRAA